MNHLEISRKLAEAIGWKPEQVRINPGSKLERRLSSRAIFPRVEAKDVDTINWAPWWRKFDYRDWSVIGPIAERYKLEVDFGAVGARHPNSLCWYYRDTVQEAIAACINETQGVK